jgi:hypothetical protein
VWGRSTVPGTAGVFGENVSGYGMVATTRGIGVGLYARGLDRAGYFDGRVEVQGDLQVSGAKSATVAHPDGSHRLLYALESPQSWFEDFGRSRISQGRARVELDSDFAALVQTTDYHVFLTPEGDSNGLCVRGRNSDSFEVCEQQGGRAISHSLTEWLPSARISKRNACRGWKRHRRRSPCSPCSLKG